MNKQIELDLNNSKRGPYLWRGSFKLEWMNPLERIDEKGRPMKERTNSLLGTSSFLSALPASPQQSPADRNAQL